MFFSGSKSPMKLWPIVLNFEGRILRFCLSTSYQTKMQKSFNKALRRQIIPCLLQYFLPSSANCTRRRLFLLSFTAYYRQHFTILFVLDS